MERRCLTSSMSSFVVFVFLTLSLLVLGAESYQCEREVIFDNAKFFSCPGPQDSRNAIYCCGNKLSRYCCSTPSFGDDDSIGKRPLDDVDDDLESSGAEDENEIIPDLSDSTAERSTIVAGLAKLVGIIIGVAIFVIIVCVICCCCCPFCLIAKKRSRGQIIRTNSQTTQPPVVAGAAYTLPPDQFNQQQQQQQQMQFNQQQQMLNPQQQYVPYPNQAPSPMGYQPNPGMYLPGGMAYPPAGTVYPPGGVAYPPGVGYPAGANPPPYPGLAESQPTDYQPAFEKTGYQTQPAYNPNY